MPCSQHNDSSPEDWRRGGDLSIRHNADKLRRELERTEAMLCAMIKMKQAFDAGANELDMDFWREQGVTPDDIEAWWKVHAAKDAARVRDQRRKAELEVYKESARAKLSPAERKVLGL